MNISSELLQFIFLGRPCIKHLFIVVLLSQTVNCSSFFSHNIKIIFKNEIHTHFYIKIYLIFIVMPKSKDIIIITYLMPPDLPTPPTLSHLIFYLIRGHTQRYLELPPEVVWCAGFALCLEHYMLTLGELWVVI